MGSLDILSAPDRWVASATSTSPHPPGCCGQWWPLLLLQSAHSQPQPVELTAQLAAAEAELHEQASTLKGVQAQGILGWKQQLAQGSLQSSLQVRQT